MARTPLEGDRPEKEHHHWLPSLEQAKAVGHSSLMVKGSWSLNATLKWLVASEN